MLSAGALFAMLLILCRLFPSTGDDWFREQLGATIHSPADLISAVTARWRTVNSRILGNVLAYSAACRPWLRAFLRAGILSGLSVAVTRTVGFGRMWGLPLMAAALMVLPRAMFAQIYPWAAGFFNYVPPVALILASLLLLERTMDGEKVLWRPGRMAMAFLGGFCGQLFIEHCTLYALWAGVVILGWQLWRYRSVSPVTALYLLGIVLGAALLFASPVYRTVAESANSEYQLSAAGGLAGVLEMARTNYPELLDEMIVACPVLFVSMTGLGMICGIQSGRRGAVDFALLAGLAAAGALLLAGRFLPVAEGVLRIAGALWLLLVMCGSWRWISRRDLRNRALFFEVSAVVVTLPLLAVRPIGPRCLFAAYVFLLVAAGCMLRAAGAERIHAKTAGTASVLAALLVFGYYFRIMVPVHTAEVQRTAAIGEAMAQGQSSVQLTRLPYGTYFWEPDTNKMQYTYYYETPGDLEIVFPEE